MPNINIPQKRIEELEGALEGKQDTLIPGANISIVNNVISSSAGGDIPTGIYTEDNLVAGDNITFTQGSNGVDEHTLGLWHFDGNSDNVITGTSALTLQNFSNSYTETAKFGSRAASYLGSNCRCIFNTQPNEFTVDFWFNSAAQDNNIIYVGGRFKFGKGHNGWKAGVYSSDLDTLPTLKSFSANTWYHIACVKKSDGTCLFFINGEKLTEFTGGNPTYYDYAIQSGNGTIYDHVDELRISDVARWTTDFTPPSRPYSTGTVTSINSTVDTSNLVTDEELESGLAGKQDTLTQTQLDTLNTAYTNTNLVFNRNLVVEDIYSDDTILLASLIDNNNVSFANATLVENTGTIDSTYTHFNSNSYQFNSYDTSTYGTGTKYLTYGLGQKLNGIDFTIDFWYYIRNINQSQRNTVINLKNGDTSYLNLNAGGMLYINGEYDSYTTTISKTTWNHYALTYSNTTGVIKTYINGLLAGTSTSSVPNLLSGDINFSAYCTTYAVGAMQGLRIRKGIRSNNDDTFTVPTDFATTTLTANKSLNADVDLSNYATTSALTTGLASKQDTLTATQLNNINNAYTSENLTAGSGIEFAEVSGGIDANTLSLYHFDTDLVDSISGTTTVTTTNSIVTDTYKFGGASLGGSDLEYGNTIVFPSVGTGDFTIDFWIYATSYWLGGSSGTGLFIGISGTLNGGVKIYGSGSTGGSVCAISEGNFTVSEWQSVFNLNQWNHLALQRNSGTYSFYVNGSLFKQATTTNYSGTPILDNFVTNGSYIHLDEVRFSDVARYSGNFTPPASAYTSGTTKQIKTDNTVAKTSDLSDYLPLTGGTLTGKLTVQTGSGIEFKDTAGNTRGHIRADDVFYIQSESNNIYMQGSGTFANVQVKQNGWQTVQTTFNKGVANGIASLDENAKVPAAQLPLDTALDTTSDNPVKNSVIANTVNTINTAIQQVADVTKRGIYELSTVITPVSGTATVVLQDDISIYAIAPTASTTIVFDKTHLTVPSNAFTTFYLVLNFTSGTQTITFPNNVQWGNISPTGTANVCYMYSFMQPYGTDIWIGNEMMSWQQNAIVYEEESGSGV